MSAGKFPSSPDQIARLAARVLQVRHQIPYRLDDPARVRVSGGCPGHGRACLRA